MLESALDWAGPEGVARVYAWTGQNDLAFEWLQRMVDHDGPERVADVKTDLYAGLTSDSRWQPFLDRNGYPDQDYSMIKFDPILPPEVRKALDTRTQFAE